MKYTKYRSVGDGYCRWLQYQKKFQILGIKFSYWANVPSDYWDEWMHEGISSLKRNWYICSYDFDFNEFVAKYPNIDEWMRIMNERIRQKKNEIENRKAERHSRNSGIEQLPS